MTNMGIEGWTKALMKTIRLHTYHTFIFWWCFMIRSWTFWYMLCKWELLLITFATVLTLIQSFLCLVVLKLFSFSTVRTSISFSSMNFNIGILDKIFLSCASSIFNNSSEEMSSLISTSVLLQSSYFLSNSNWIPASDSISYPQG